MRLLRWALGLWLHIRRSVLESNQNVLRIRLRTVELQHFDLAIHKGLSSISILSEFALLMLDWIDFTIQSVNFNFLLNQTFWKLVFRIKVVLNELFQVDVTVVVLIALAEDFLNDFSTMSKLYVFHFQELQHFWLVDTPITISIDLFKILLKLDQLSSLHRGLHFYYLIINSSQI